MLKDEIKAAYTRGKWALVLRGLLGIALGVVILARPLESVAAFALVIAIWALVDGIVNVVHAFDLRAVTSYWWVMLLSGLVSFGFGAAALYYYPGLSLTFAVLWTAWWLMTAGALGIYLAVQERKADVPWGGTMTLGVITLAVGVLAVVYPGITLAALMGTLAGFGIVAGIVMLVVAGKMQSLQGDVKRAFDTPSRA
jgi:uncharacterized membrane protein HdeD (DUF308 family)